MYEIQVASQARKYIEKLDAPTKKRFRDQIDELKKDPWGNSKPVVNTKPPIRSCRIGGWRIVLQIWAEDKKVLIAMVYPRGQVYERT